jgi:hypothetical protein
MLKFNILAQFGVLTRIIILIIGSMEELTPISSSEIECSQSYQ